MNIIYTKNVDGQMNEKEQFVRAIEALGAIEKRVMNLHYGLEDGIRRTMQEIAIITGYTTTQIEEIHTNALRSMRNSLAE